MCAGLLFITVIILSELVLPVGKPAVLSKLAVALDEVVAKGSLVYIWGAAEFLLTVSKVAGVTSGAAATEIELAEFGLLEVWAVSELLFTMGKMAFITFGTFVLLEKRTKLSLVEIEVALFRPVLIHCPPHHILVSLRQYIVYKSKLRVHCDC